MKVPMKICYLARASSIHTQRWAKYFADNGHEVHLISPGSFGDNKIENIEVHVLKEFPPIRIISFPINILYTMNQVRGLIKAIKPDIVHAHYLTGYKAMAALTGFHPFVVTAWGSDILVAPRESRMARWTAKHALKRADLITCDAEHIKRPLVELGAKPERIKIINFGIDTHQFRPKRGSERIRKKLRMPRSPMVISLRALDPHYDIESLIKSIPMVLKEIPDTVFVIAGEGPQERSLTKLGKSLGVSDNIRFVGQIPNDELPEYLGLADVYVSTALLDAGLAASTAEAMACEVPVVITDFGDNRKWVEDGVNGYIIPLRSPDILASRIVHLIRDKETSKKFARVSRNIIEERNDWEKEMGKMEGLYQELVRRRGKRR